MCFLYFLVLFGDIVVVMSMVFDNIESYHEYGRARIGEVCDVIRISFLTSSGDFAQESRDLVVDLLNDIALKLSVCLVGNERVLTSSSTIESWLEEVRGWELFVDDEEAGYVTAASA